MELSYFNDNKNFHESLKKFFKDLNVPVSYLTSEPAKPADILTKIIGLKNESYTLMDKVYMLGMVDENVFETGKTDTTLNAIRQGKKDYDGLLIFGVTLKTENPSRTHLADITRAFNREFNSTPIVVVFKYGNHITFAAAERTKYKQDWKEGEKVGKVSLLKDIYTLQPHRGHVAILNQLVIPTTGKNAVSSFTQLYYYWQSVFSISVLNKAFYDEIIEWFNKAVADIKIPSQTAKSERHKDFTVRLTARLIFIWFLKELKVVKDELLLPEFDNGDHNDLIKPKKKGTDYYKFILQNLFFNALNSEKKDRNQKEFDVYSSSFSEANEIKKLIFYSPYLNGGLFDKHQYDCYEEGKVNNAFVVPDDLFLDKKTGINSILSRYKFTIAENTPLEEEIAVDPEMLGRIFENLLAEQSDDTKEAARKNAGAFYTPRPVVSYMCRNTLLKHIDIELKPENAKQVIHKMLDSTVLDPACGSGAFPMGMLEEMMQVLTTVDPGGKVWVAEMMKSKDEGFREHIAEMFADGQVRYIKKLGLLRNCLFGVDLLEYAIEITKLRCWLSLIVEQRVDFKKENYNLKPLPNLEFKFYKKNSLFRFYKNDNLNDVIKKFDEEGLLKELVNLENQYFIAKSDRHGTKEEIKNKIINLLERLVDSQSEAINKELKVAQNRVNYLVTNNGSDTEIKKAKKKVETLSKELAELDIFKNTIKDYFIECVVFPGIFNSEHKNPGFDIVIGNPPYVNTKLLSKMGISKKIEEEYGYCDDLYNHFTFRGLELLKKGGLLSYITSDTFLTLQSKKNMRMEFLGIKNKKKQEGHGDLFGDILTENVPNQQPDLFGNKKAVQTELISINNKINEIDDAYESKECQVLEIINTPKAFAALVDTAIFTLKKNVPDVTSELIYIDIRKPTAQSFNITEEEWKQIKSSKENITGWERILDKTFGSLGHNVSNWRVSHTCDGDKVYKDEKSNLLKFKISFEPYRKSINYAIFSPTMYNCQILEKIVKPARPIFDDWWSKIETSRLIENNRKEIEKFNSKLKPHNWSIIGLITDGGVGLQTGDNGRFVGYRASSRFADRCKETRSVKLWKAINDEPKIKRKFELLSNCENFIDVQEVLDNLKEIAIWELFDEIKEKFGLRVFGKGYMYRIIPESMIFDVENITDKQKLEGIKGKKTFVPYDKGDKEGNRWYSETSYLIDWSQEAVATLSTDEAARWQGYNFFFRNGFCWNAVLNPNSNYIKCRLKQSSVNDVQSMTLYSETSLPVEYITTIINSYLSFKTLREFINGSAAVQMNDIRKLPIKIPNEKELKEFNKKFQECLTIKKKYFVEEIDRAQMNAKIRPIEIEIDDMVNKLYGIDAQEEIISDEVEEEVFIDDEDDSESED